MSSEATEAYAIEHGLGGVGARLRLGGKLPLAGGGKLPVDLCLTSRGAWLIAQEGRFVGRALEAGDSERVRYERGKLRDHLVVEGSELSVPAGRAVDARRLIAIGRVRRAFALDAREARLVGCDRYLEPSETALRELIAAVLDPQDIAILLMCAGEREVTSALGAQVNETTHVLLSADGALRIRLSELGDYEVTPLSAAELRSSTHKGGLLLSDGQVDIAVRERAASLSAELVELSAYQGAERLMEAARRLWLARKAKEVPDRPRQLLGAAAERGAALAALLAALLALEMGRGAPSRSELERVVAALAGAGTSVDEVMDAFQRWQFSAPSGRELVRELGLFGAAAEPWALALHRAAYGRLDLAQPDAESAWDAELAEHELRSGQPERSRRLVEARLKRVAPDEDAVLAPERASFAHVERVRLYEILVREAERRGQRDVRSLAALACLEPSSEGRLLSLARAEPALAEDARVIARASRALACLAPGGLRDAEADAPSDVPPALEKSALESVRHPLARGAGRLATRLSELVASVPEPDLGFLRDFCEELAPDRHADAARALRRATHLLGLGAVAAYISHGARSVGVRAFGSREPFVLIGQSHVAKEGPYVLRGAELDFALGAELSHLTFGHQRVTAGEVWAGAAGKTREALVLLGFVVPLVAEFGGPRAQRVLGRIGAEAIERAAGRAAKLGELLGRDDERPSPALGQRNEELILAHRLVQLTADRAGLVAAQDLRAALRSVLLTRADYREVLLDAEGRGLLPALAARRTASAAFADLLVRVRALIAFYLSSDFDALSVASARGALTGQ